MEEFAIGSFNVRSIQSEVKKDQIAIDLEKYSIDILCLQETKIQNGADENLKGGGRLICFQSNSLHYGNGFIINKKWKNNIHKTWKISDRICVLQVRSDHKSKTKFISIINVYAPTNEQSKKKPEVRDSFYYDLNKIIQELNNNKSLILIAGDFNSKVGKKQEGESCLGSYSKGNRNENGECLVEFCEESRLFITNSAFNHPSRHQTTWTIQRKDKNNGLITNVYNQIDFIICKQSNKHIIRNARSYAGTLVTSDHRLVKTSIQLNWPKVWRKRNKTQNATKIDVSRIANDNTCVKQYQLALDTHLKYNHNKNKPAETVNETWKTIQHNLKISAEECVGFINKTGNNVNRSYDKEIANLSLQQKNIRVQIQNTQCLDNRAKLQKERNLILRNIRDKVIKTRNNELDKLVENIDKCQNDQRMFKATQLLNKKHYENPKIEDNQGRLVTDKNEILEITTEYFQNKFTDANQHPISSFRGEPRPLKEPISEREVREAFDSLKNNKAPGEDGIHAELLKYGTPNLDKTIADMFNNTFSKHQDLSVNAGQLVPIQKPGKPKGQPQNLRPITLLNTIRKALSIITLKRIRPEIETYLSHSQSGFRPERSTSDVVWAHRWLTAKATIENLDIKVTGIDMSAAFDTINRSLLINILEPITTEDQLRLIQFLISKTPINVKINGATEIRTFNSNIGTPQGDGLSPVLFIVYLEHALKEVRDNISKYTQNPVKYLPTEIIYADDVDFIGLNHVNTTNVQDILKKYQLRVNTDKTELTIITRLQNEWKKVKKVGSLLGIKEDIARRKQLSTVALAKLNNVWFRKDKIRKNTRLKLYRSLVKSVLLYNCGTWGLTKKDERMLNSFHRKQLRKILGIHFPVKITNKSLYKKCNETPISLQVLDMRWNLFGHILRRNKEIPANQAMIFYFTKQNGKFPGRPKTSLPITLHNDLNRLDKPLKLKTLKDLESLRRTARNRRRWKLLTQKIRKAAEALTSDD